MHFDLRHQQHVQDAERVIVAMDDDRASRGRMRHEIAVLHEKRTPVAELHGEWPERIRVENVLQLLDGHHHIIAKTARCGINLPVPIADKASKLTPEYR